MRVVAMHLQMNGDQRFEQRTVAANTGVGLFVDKSIGAHIGGTGITDRNIISGNGQGGIQLESIGSGQVVQNTMV